MRNCILREMYYVPIERVANPQLVLRDMRVDPKWFNTKEPRPKPIFQCFETEDEYIAFPIWYGMQTYPDPDYINETSAGQPLIAPKRPDPYHEKASPGQPQFFADTLAHFAAGNPTGMAVAGTGTGKTANALNMAAERGRSTLIVTDREFLGFEQWIPEAKEKIGLTDDQIGIIQGDRCEFHKPFCVGIAASLYSREYPPEFYSAFGTIIYDEMHKFGAREMSRILQMFSAQVQMGQTATVNRKDGCHKLYLDHFGPSQIQATGQALRCQMRVIDYWDERGGKLGGTHGARMSALAWDDTRNQIIVREVIKMYNEGRNILVIGDDIKHLQRLEMMCWRAGVNKERTGQFSRERYIFTQEPGVHNGEKVMIKKQKKAKVTNEYLNWVKNHARIIFATYGMMKEGVDIPRLDGGINATPRTEARQVIGRIRRPLPGKRIPLWITVRDRQHFALERYYEQWLADCLQGNVELLHD